MHTTISATQKCQRINADVLW